MPANRPARLPLRIGILGAARIAPLALVRPARTVPGVVVAAIAARDRARARAFAARHGIARVADSYEGLVRDPEIDAVYLPLPNSLHCEWSIRALEAGKHVLCEKPLAANAAEAERMAAAAARAGRLLMEAFHYRYHPLAERIKAIVTSGELGMVRELEAHMCVPLPFPRDIRYRYELAGGATMDVGCYAVHLLRFLAGREPEVLAARARCIAPNVDRYMAADLRFPGSISGRMTCALLSGTLVRATAKVRGDTGSLWVLNPYAPQYFHLLRVRSARGVRWERVAGEATYTHQLRAFVAAVQGGGDVPTNAWDGAANMRVIDAIYERAGLRPRGTGGVPSAARSASVD